MKKSMLGCAVLLAMSSSAFAGTCASPDILPSNTQTSGTTCGGVVGINMGGAIYEHPSNVFAFTYQPGEQTDDQIRLQGSNIELSLVASCSDDGSQGPAAINVATGDGAVVLEVDGNGLVAGTQYFVVVSTDPSIPVVPGTPTCGEFVVDADFLPVELQSFSVD